MSALAETIRSQEAILGAVLDLDLGAAPERLDHAERTWLVGTGTSQHAAELGAAMLRLAGIDARSLSSASFAGMRPAPDPGDALMLISHTGETAFARAVRRGALERGSPLVSITGVGVGWEEGIEVAPRERSETYTASYTAALLTLARIAGALGAPELDEAALEATVGAVALALSEPDPGSLTRPQRLLVIAGAGPGAVTAREGALKLREAARVPSEGFEAEYLLHGSAVPLGSADALVLLDPAADPDGLLAALGSAAEQSGVEIAAIGDPAMLDPLLMQIPLTVRLQLLASQLADEGGHDPDHAIEGPWASETLWSIPSS